MVTIGLYNNINRTDVTASKLSIAEIIAAGGLFLLAERITELYFVSKKAISQRKVPIMDVLIFTPIFLAIGAGLLESWNIWQIIICFVFVQIFVFFALWVVFDLTARNRIKYAGIQQGKYLHASRYTRLRKKAHPFRVKRKH